MVARPQGPAPGALCPAGTARPDRAVQQGLLGPTVPNFWVCNPAYAQVQNDQATADKAFKRVEEIFAKYPIAQG